MVSKLTPVIIVDDKKCVNCHSCISACPVKFCMNGSGNTIQINHDLCIGCGSCIQRCKHNARRLSDDSTLFFDELVKETSIVAIVAPAVAAVFPEQYLRLNSWLKSIGIKAVFDVSFGAELTVRSYLEHLRQNKPKCIIAQPCPALVAFIEIYHPELLEFLAPADSPMMHTMKMVKEFYPEYASSKFVILSPCIAKKREFDEVGIGDYNVTFLSVKNYLDERKISLSSFDEKVYDNPPAERAVLFSTPGGLLQTALRWNQNVGKIARKIEGPHIIYHYLEELINQIKGGKAPVLIDCLNCDLGCNGGPGTGNVERSPDELEFLIETRNRAEQEKWRKKGFSQKNVRKKIEKLLSKYWSPGLYDREYVNRSGTFKLQKPDRNQLTEIYEKMYKFKDEDLLNCTSCGYGRCEDMALAIFNGLNKPENCSHYKTKQSQALMEKVQERINEENKAVSSIGNSLKNINHVTENVSSAVYQLHSSVTEISKNANSVSVIAQNGVKYNENAGSILNQLNETVQQVGKIIELINGIADQTRLLALNATIEAASAGDAGKGFTVVANEIKQLALETTKASSNIFKYIESMRQQFDSTLDAMKNITNTIHEIGSTQVNVAASVEEQSVVISNIADEITNVNSTMQAISHDLNKLIMNYN